MSDAMVDRALETYERGCTDCGTKMKAPTLDELVEGEMACPGCGTMFDVDMEDVRFVVALLWARIERLERRCPNPLADCPIL